MTTKHEQAPGAAMQPMKIELGFYLPRMRRFALEGDAEALDRLIQSVAHLAAWHGALAHENGLDANSAAEGVTENVLRAMKGEGRLASLSVTAEDWASLRPCSWSRCQRLTRNTGLCDACITSARAISS